jgi:uncharacterized protein
MQQGEIIVGVISDTHGLLRPQAIGALRGCHMIIHAGDVGDPLTGFAISRPHLSSAET